MKQPQNPFNPGEILLEEFLEPDEITADAALDLAAALGTSAKLWRLYRPPTTSTAPRSGGKLRRESWLRGFGATPDRRPEPRMAVSPSCR